MMSNYDNVIKNILQNSTLVKFDVYEDRHGEDSELTIECIPHHSTEHVILEFGMTGYGLFLHTVNGINPDKFVVVENNTIKVWPRILELLSIVQYLVNDEECLLLEQILHVNNDTLTFDDIYTMKELQTDKYNRKDHSSIFGVDNVARMVLYDPQHRFYLCQNNSRICVRNRSCCSQCEYNEWK